VRRVDFGLLLRVRTGMEEGTQSTLWLSYSRREPKGYTRRSGGIMDEHKLTAEEYTNRLLGIIADELYVTRKDKQDREDQESGRQTTWRAAGERDALSQSLETRRQSLKL